MPVTSPPPACFTPFPRSFLIPLLVASPYTTPEYVSNSYADHTSILKFIERNWSLPTISRRSRDNLPNPRANDDNPYAPVNTQEPALFDLFRFSDRDGEH